MTIVIMMIGGGLCGFPLLSCGRSACRLQSSLASDNELIVPAGWASEAHINRPSLGSVARTLPLLLLDVLAPKNCKPRNGRLLHSMAL